VPAHSPNPGLAIKKDVFAISANPIVAVTELSAETRSRSCPQYTTHYRVKTDSKGVNNRKTAILGAIYYQNLQAVSGRIVGDRPHFSSAN
jgi:hypothetical protein